jgi:hypothetical protein
MPYDDEHAPETRQALTGFCILGITGGGLAGPVGTECEPWCEWKELLLRRTLAEAIANCPAGRVIVEVEAGGEVIKAKLGLHASYGQPIGLWAVSGDDIASAREAAEVYGLQWRGVAAGAPKTGEGAHLAMYRFRREFASKQLLTRPCMPAIHPFAIYSALIAGMLALMIGALALMVSATPTHFDPRTGNPYQAGPETGQTAPGTTGIAAAAEAAKETAPAMKATQQEQAAQAGAQVPAR